MKYLAYLIRSFFVIKDASCSLAAHADLCRAPRGLIMRAEPPLVAQPMYSPVGIGGHTPLLLDRILENTPPLEPLCLEAQLNHKEVSSSEAEPITSLKRPSHKPEDLEEGFHPLDLLYFEDDFFKEFKNTSKYSYQKRPLVPITPLEPLDEEFLGESIKELTAILRENGQKRWNLLLKKFRFILPL